MQCLVNVKVNKYFINKNKINSKKHILAIIALKMKWVPYNVNKMNS